jgi:hypothetical protein
MALLMLAFASAVAGWLAEPPPARPSNFVGPGRNPFGRALARRTVLFVVWLLGTLLGEASARAQISREYDLKAVFVFNFAQFVEWPPAAFLDEQGPLIIGVLGTDPFKGALQTVVNNEKVRNRPVRVESYSRPEEAIHCHILFISSSEQRRLSYILTALRGRPILTVSDIDDFARQGGMIRFITESGRVRLRINNDAARAAGLMVSAKLLRVAEVIPAAPRE